MKAELSKPWSVCFAIEKNQGLFCSLSLRVATIDLRFQARSSSRLGHGPLKAGARVRPFLDDVSSVYTRLSRDIPKNFFDNVITVG